MVKLKKKKTNDRDIHVTVQQNLFSIFIHVTMQIFFFSQGRFCASYDMGLGRVIEDWKKPCSRCPFQYPSNVFNSKRFIKYQ